MSRVDKTESAVGVVRAVLAADYVPGDIDGIFGVGLNASGLVVKGAGTTGVIAVVNPLKSASKAGRPVDLFVLADIVDVGDSANDPTLVPGKKAYASNTTGVITTTAPGDLTTVTAVGFTVEADRLIVRL